MSHADQGVFPWDLSFFMYLGQKVLIAKYRLAALLTKRN